MKNTIIIKALIIAAVMAAAAGVLVLKEKQTEEPPAPVPAEIISTENHEMEVVNLPTLIDLGSDKCANCKMMIPVLEELGKVYDGQLNVVFHDVWKNPDVGKEFGIRLIPTQIFLAPDSTELFRHEGFFSKDDILAKWKELGIVLSPREDSQRIKESNE